MKTTPKEPNEGTGKEAVLNHLRKGKAITHNQCLSLYNYSRLADIILKLRKDGHDIKARPKKVRVLNKRTGKRRTSRIAEYYLP